MNLINIESRAIVTQAAVMPDKVLIVDESKKKKKLI